MWRKNNDILSYYTKNFIMSGIESAEAGELTDIPRAYMIYAYNEPKLKLTIAQRLNAVVNRLDANQLVKLDSIFRCRTSMEWDVDWSKVQIDLRIPGMTDDEKITVLGLGTFNPNGYFRERCLKHLFDYSNIKAVRFICLRLRDWVPQIMDSAKGFISEMITSGKEQNLLELIPYLIKMRQSRLKGPQEMLNLLKEALSKKTELLKAGALNKDISVKRFCYNILLQVLNDTEYFFERMQKDRDTVSKKMILKSILEYSPAKDLINRIPVLLKNRSGEIRRLAMDRLYRSKADNINEILKKMLLDKNAMVREEARYLLGKIEKTDYRLYYISNLECTAAIYGLGETGKSEDVQMLIPLVAAESPQKMIAAMTAIAGLTDDEYLELFIMNLANKNMSVSKRAFRLLQKKDYSAYAERIHRIFVEEESFYIRRNCALLLRSLPKWDAIKYIVELCADKENDINLIGETAYSNWADRYNRSYVRPSEDQVEGLQTAIKKYRWRLTGGKAEYLEFLIRELN